MPPKASANAGATTKTKAKVKPKNKEEKWRENASTNFNIFKAFLKLPVELRRMIWRMAAYHPRLIRAHWDTSTFGTEIHRWSTAYEFTAGSKPGILGTCRESRDVGLRAYDRIPNRISLINGKPEMSKATFINFAADDIYFTNFPERAGFEKTLRRLMKCNLVDKHSSAKGLRSVAISYGSINQLCVGSISSRPTAPLIYQVVQDHQQLREIFVVSDFSSNFKHDPDVVKYDLHPVKNYEISMHHLDLVLDRPAGDIFTSRDTLPKLEQEKFEKFKESHPEWKQPLFTPKRILKQKLKTKIFAKQAK